MLGLVSRDPRTRTAAGVATMLGTVRIAVPATITLGHARADGTMALWLSLPEPEAILASMGLWLVSLAVAGALVMQSDEPPVKLSETG
jgi:hypothetical protein